MFVVRLLFAAMSGTCVTIPSGLKNYKLIFHILCFGATATPNGHTLMVLQQWRFKVTLKPFIVLLELCAGKQTPVTSDFTQDCAFNRGLRHHGCFFTFLNSLTNYNIKCRCCENSTFLSRKCAFVFWCKLKSSRRISAKLPLLRRIPSAIKIALSLFSFLFFFKDILLCQLCCGERPSDPSLLGQNCKQYTICMYECVCVERIEIWKQNMRPRCNLQHNALCS